MPKKTINPTSGRIIYLRLYEHHPDHRRVFEWIENLPRGTRGRPKITEGLVELIARATETKSQPGARSEKVRAVLTGIRSQLEDDQ